MRLIRLLKHDLAREVSGWRHRDIIDERQAERICAEYGIDYHHQTRHSYGYYALAGLGYLFLGLSVLVVVGENWQDIPRSARMIGLIILTLLTNLAGVYRYTQGRQNEAVALLALGGIFYGASIMLIAQIYHLGEHYPDGILWWAIGVLPVAIIIRSSVLMSLTMGLAMFWFFVETSLDYYPLLYPLFLIASAWFLLRIGSSLMLFALLVVGIGLMGIYTVFWVTGGFYRFDFVPEGVIFVSGYFLVLHGLAKWLAARTDHGQVDYDVTLSLWVMRFFILLLLVMSFEGPWRGLLDAQWQSPEAVMLMLISLCAAGIVLATRSGKAGSISTLVLAVVLIVVTALVIGTSDRTYAVFFQFMDNLVLAVTGIWLIVRGIRSGISHYFYMGVFTIMLTGLLRYVDLIGDYIGAAILFAVFALMLFAAARYWKSHYGTGRREAA